MAHPGLQARGWHNETRRQQESGASRGNATTSLRNERKMRVRRNERRR